MDFQNNNMEKLKKMAGFHPGSPGAGVPRQVPRSTGPGNLFAFKKMQEIVTSEKIDMGSSRASSKSRSRRSFYREYKLARRKVKQLKRKRIANDAVKQGLQMWKDLMENT